MIRRTPLRRTSGLRSESPRRVEQRAVWEAIQRTVLIRDRYECKAAKVWPEIVCHGRLDPHHRWPVGRGGPRLDKTNIVTLCRRHHDAVHMEDPLRAMELGLLFRG